MKLVPACKYKAEIEKQIQSMIYSEDSYMMSGFRHSYTVNIPDNDKNGSCFRWAILNNANQLVGFISYDIEWYDSVLRNFKIISFDKGNICIGSALKEIINKINSYNLNKMILYCIDDNPIRPKYDNLTANNNGVKYTFKEEYKDNHGVYHDLIRYDIFLKNKEMVFNLSDPKE